MASDGSIAGVAAQRRLIASHLSNRGPLRRGLLRRICRACPPLKPTQGRGPRGVGVVAAAQMSLPRRLTTPARGGVKRPKRGPGMVLAAAWLVGAPRARPYCHRGASESRPVRRLSMVGGVSGIPVAIHGGLQSRPTRCAWMVGRVSQPGPGIASQQRKTHPTPPHPPTWSRLAVCAPRSRASAENR